MTEHLLIERDDEDQKVVDGIIKFLIDNRFMMWSAEEVVRQICIRWPDAREDQVAAAFSAANEFLETSR